MSKKLQLYSLATPNGQKASIALEEMNLDYEAHKIDITKDEQFSDEFIAINPNSKIPALVDPEGDHGKPLNIMESGAILLYLAEKTGQFLPQDTANRSRVLQWVFFQMAGVGPMFGQFGHFYKMAKDKCKDPYPLERYSKETQRLLKVMDDQLNKKEYIASDEITIADFSIVPWVKCLSEFYEATDQLDLNSFSNVNRWVKTVSERPSYVKGSKVCSFD